MRLSRVQAVNIGGLRDCNLDLPDQRMLAFAGGNGTGKSKLLACLLVPWTRQVPAASDPDAPVRVELDVQFDLAERAALASYAAESGWSHGDAPEEVTLIFRREPIAGMQVQAVPDFMAALECFTNQQILQRVPSLNLIYLPAERRFLPGNTNVVDLSQLADEASLARLSEARTSSQNYGRLDDQEFESYAKALCVAGALPSESGSTDAGAVEVARWTEFKSSVDAMLYPKALLPLTRENPSELRIGLPGGGWHLVQELSSGERQALIIVSRVFRAGEGHSIIAIDEPDAYLHPTLSAALLRALTPGLRAGGRLFVATHSPAILDAIPPEAIFRLSYDQPARVVESEGERLELYRDAGFRASALTQADLLVVTEGDTDAALLPALIPALGSAALRAAGGRAEVFRTLGALSAFDVPIVGVVDADVQADPRPDALTGLCHVWSSADIEGVLLSDDNFLAAAVDGALVKQTLRSVGALKDVLENLVQGYKLPAIAEVAQRRLRVLSNVDWPSPRGEDPIPRLRAVASNLPKLTSTEIDAAVAAAEADWVASLPVPWRLVRGKWLLAEFTRQVSEFKNGFALLTAVAARQPVVAEIATFEALVHAASI